jgi:hypothetical protein
MKKIVVFLLMIAGGLAHAQKENKALLALFKDETCLSLYQQ